MQIDLSADETPTGVGNRQRTEISRNLQYLAHLGTKTSVQVMDTFYAFKKWDAEGPTGRRGPR
ncbi:hypothetical protein DF268_11785 [Streptomyces sp. V2]|uniref:hypothetical protein n=1 Tax=Streptomyces niveiscabiei TaxID=164115 RepID=UPI0006EBB67F|nr:hypothetical protein [Streptomyces niveiscabiei]PWG13343.1 hypothetical protein DF268_11785 [Streptomyces sp. V2]